VLICVAMNTSVGRQFMAGFLPGLLIATVLSIFVLIRSRKLGIEKRGKYTGRQILDIIKGSILALLFPIIVLGGIYGGFTTPTEAAAVSLIYILIIEIFFYKKVQLKELTEILSSAAATAGALTFIIASASVFTWFMTTQQVPAQIAAFIQDIIHTKTVFLASLILFLFIAGCFMDLISMTLVLGPILIPTLNLFDLDLIHFGIIAITSAEVAFMTPPFGVNLFVTMTVTDEPLGYVAKSTMPFMFICLAMVAILAFFPEISLFLPNLFYN
jgi:C4-dicarboxylate transporter DctM subunit